MHNRFLDFLHVRLLSYSWLFSLLVDRLNKMDISSSSSKHELIFKNNDIVYSLFRVLSDFGDIRLPCRTNCLTDFLCYNAILQTETS